jgi:predicted RNA binding protein YcfA (HicA-like mRNA interferase family)
MAKLPVCSGEEAIKAFERAGWKRSRQKGSHVSLVHPSFRAILTVPLHRELASGTLRSLIRLAGMSVDDFADLL